jgi:hypothetical protein
MKYTTAGAFRQALEERLRQQTFAAHPGLTRLRKMIAFDRFLARLAGKEPTSWVLKDGFAIQLRFGAQARATKDIDLAVLKNWSAEEAADWLRDAASLDLRDWCEFEISEPSEAATGAPKAGFRFPVRCLLDGRAFENFHLDVGIGDVILDSPELVTGPPLLDFAEITPATVPCYPRTAQIAEKVHTYTRTYASGLTSRARDLADVLLAASIAAFQSSNLRRAMQATFAARGTHALPESFPDPPKHLSGPYRKLAREMDLTWKTISDAGEAAARFLNPVLKGNGGRVWDPTVWKWK